MPKTPSFSAPLNYPALYGDESGEEVAEFVHIEEIRTRSRLLDWQISAHRHQGLFQILFVKGGTTQISLDGQRVSMRAPCVVTIPSGVIHAFEFSEDTVGYILTIADSCLQDSRYSDSRELLAPLLREPELFDLTNSAGLSENILKIVQLFNSEFEKPRPGRNSMFEWLSRSLLMTLRRHDMDKQTLAVVPSQSRRVYAAFCELVELNYKQHWSMQQYADELGLSQARLNRLCRSYRKKTALKMVQDRLTLEAQRLLTYTSANASMVCYELGFKDPAYFSRFFKRNAGMAPGKYQESMIHLYGS